MIAKTLPKALLTLALTLFGQAGAQAIEIKSFAPQGKVSGVESITVQFDEAVAPFGQPQFNAPFSINCTAPNVQGSGRWLDQHRWTYVFSQALDAGIQCAAIPAQGFQSFSGQSIKNITQYHFETAEPTVISSRPYGNQINEDQVFALRFNGNIAASSLLENSYCIVQGLGEQVPTRLIATEARNEIINTFYGDTFKDQGDKVHLLQCQRTLPAEADVTLVVGQQSFDYQVRKEFTASLNCQRENSRSNCLPSSPIIISFSEPIASSDASGIKLQVNKKEHTPDNDWNSSGNYIHSVRFNSPFPPESDLKIILPSDLKDESGRPLANAQQFPLNFKTAAYPPLVKFASGSFGVVERLAGVPKGKSEQSYPPTVALTVRDVEPNLITLDTKLSAGSVNDKIIQSDEEVIRWIARLNRLQFGNWSKSQIESILADRPIDYSDQGEKIDVRSVSVLKNIPNTRKLDLPGIDGSTLRPFEVIGVPVPEPGVHILEVKSPRLGRSLTESGAPMYINTMVLVTNLSVHLKRGRDDALIWVTALDDGKVVPGAKVSAYDCDGNFIAEGTTNNQGLWHYHNALPDRYCEKTASSAVFVSARIPADHPQAHGKADYAYALSSWDSGIESWRFNVPTNTDPLSTRISHTVLDRNLLRAGETVSMKHYLREQTRDGLSANNIAELPGKLIIQHAASGQSQEIPLKWHATPTGGLTAISSYNIPKNALLGTYYAYMESKGDYWYDTTEFHVEEFKLPVFSATLQVSDPNSGHESENTAALVSPKQLNADVQISYIDGGPARQQPIALSAMSQGEAWVNFKGLDDYSFTSPEDNANHAPHVFINNQTEVLDNNGGIRLLLNNLPAAKTIQNWVFETSFTDPNGQIQTVVHNRQVWPASIHAGIKTNGWLADANNIKAQVVAVTPNGQLQANVPVVVNAVKHTTYSVRKRLVGGFYSYDNHTSTENLGVVCKGATNSDGMVDCDINLNQQGSIELIATVTDSNNRTSQASTSIWISKNDSHWFGGTDDDRMDVIPTKKEWQPGEVAEFQVRTPFKQATALVTVEREGVLESFIQQLDSSDPVVRIHIKPEWQPNIYVSVLAVRGRVRDIQLPDLSKLEWNSPSTWVNTVRQAINLNSGPTALVDLSKPSYRLGLASIDIADNTDKLNVNLTTEKARYQVGDELTVNVEVTTADGKPAANATIAFAAVDKALLELLPNNTWNVLPTMRQKRSYGVRTATAQMHVVGRRHYGRKALPSGGGGGLSPTRELLDTLLVWQPSIHLDADGKASIQLKLNDSITSFRLVAIADYGSQHFGTGTLDISSTKNLQVISGLPALVRSGDTYTAQATVRNTTNRNMVVSLLAKPSSLLSDYSANGIELKAGAATTIQWPVQLASDAVYTDNTTIKWQLTVTEDSNEPNAAQDSLIVTQIIEPSVPLRVQQSATFVMDQSRTAVPLNVQLSDNTIKNAKNLPVGGLQITASSGPQVSLDHINEWFKYYSFGSLEYKVSKAIALRDNNTWANIIETLPTYIDSDGLLRYFPGSSQGSEVLTAYVLSVLHEANNLGWGLNIPQQEADVMLKGLSSFVQGHLQRDRWSPVADRDLRKLLAAEALARYGVLKPQMLESITIEPNNWPTTGILAWLGVLKYAQNIETAPQHLNEISHILQGRMLSSGSSMVFSDNANNASGWLMASVQSNQARLLLNGSILPEFAAAQHLLLQGLISSQFYGTWGTSPANALAVLALNRNLQNSNNRELNGAILLTTKNSDVLSKLNWSDAVENTATKTKQMHTYLPWEQIITHQTGTSNNINTTLELGLKQNGAGTPWVNVSALAAVANTEAVDSGLALTRSIKPVNQAVPGQWSVGDIYKVHLTITARTPRAWVMVEDYIPAAAHILGGTIARNTTIAQSANQEDQDDSWWLSFAEHGFGSYRGYFEYLPAGKSNLSYTVRLSSAGTFSLPASRVQSIYEPDIYGELPVVDKTIKQLGAE